MFVFFFRLKISFFQFSSIFAAVICIVYLLCCCSFFVHRAPTHLRAPSILDLRVSSIMSILLHNRFIYISQSKLTVCNLYFLFFLTDRVFPGSFFVYLVRFFTLLNVTHTHTQFASASISITKRHISFVF